VNLTPVVSQLSILTKRGQVARFQPNWAQQEFLAESARQFSTTGRVRIIVLKARQLGISTLTEACLFSLCFVFDEFRATVIAHEAEASKNLLAMTDRYWRTYPYRHLYTTKRHASNHMEWNETHSSLRVATAGNKETGRSATNRGLHMSELAFWPNPRNVMLGLGNTLPSEPGTFAVIESTANGEGDYFHREWVAAEQGESEYTPLFFPWHRHPEYLASYMGIPYTSLGRLDEDEQFLRKIGLSDDRLAWRRWAILNRCGGDPLRFKQEYPTTAEEAFITSGTRAFPADALRAVYAPEHGKTFILVRDGDRVTAVPDEKGPLTLYRSLSTDPDWGTYFIGADPTRTNHGDWSVAQIINRRTKEQVGVWRGKIDPATFGEELFKLGLLCNRAEIAVEKQGSGELVVGKLLGMRYPRVWTQSKIDKDPGNESPNVYGWTTNMQSKHSLIGWLIKMMVDRSITIHHKDTFEECNTYVVDENGTYGPNTNEGHDDCVMSLAIAYLCEHMSAPTQPYGTLTTTAERVAALPWADWQDPPST
jgi:hypothetical protein